MNNDAAFCPHCGAKNESAAVPPAATNDWSAEPVAPVTQAAETAVVPKPNNHKIVGMVATLVVAVAVLIGVGALVKSLFFADSYEDVARKSMAAMIDCDWEKGDRYCLIETEDYWQDMVEALTDELDLSESEYYARLEDEFGGSVKDCKSMLKAYGLYARKRLEKSYGEYTTSVKVLDSEKLSGRELNDAIDTFKERFDDMCDGELKLKDYVDVDKITEGYSVEVKMSIDGEDDDDSDTITLTVVKYKGKWKVLSAGVVDFSGYML